MNGICHRCSGSILLPFPSKKDVFPPFATHRYLILVHCFTFFRSSQQFILVFFIFFRSPLDSCFFKILPYLSSPLLYFYPRWYWSIFPREKRADYFPLYTVNTIFSTSSQSNITDHFRNNSGPWRWQHCWRSKFICRGCEWGREKRYSLFVLIFKEPITCLSTCNIFPPDSITQFAVIVTYNTFFSVTFFTLLHMFL